MNQVNPYETVPSFEFLAGPARIYRSKDGLHQVVIADSLGTEWDTAPASDTRIWPSDVFEAISRLPNPEFVKEVVLQNQWTQDREETPASKDSQVVVLQNQALLDAAGSPASPQGKLAAQTFSTGRIVLSLLMNREMLDSTLLLAWSRLLWFKYEVLTHFFRYAAWLERDGYFIALNAKTSYVENWALHLVANLLAADSVNLTALISQAPLRAIMLAGALQRALDEDNDTSHPELETRLQRVTDQAVPEAQKLLLSLAQNEDSLTQEYAFKLLLLLGSESQLAELRIKEANLANEPHTNSVLSKLGAIKTITNLSLSQTLISREGTEFLSNLTNLRKLDLSDTKIMSSSLAPLRSLSQLEELDLSGTQINDSALPSLGQLSGLRKLNISDTTLVTSKEVIQKLLPNCEVVAR